MKLHKKYFEHLHPTIKYGVNDFKNPILPWLEDHDLNDVKLPFLPNLRIVFGPLKTI